MIEILPVKRLEDIKPYFPDIRNWSDMYAFYAAAGHEVLCAALYRVSGDTVDLVALADIAGAGDTLLDGMVRAVLASAQQQGCMTARCAAGVLPKQIEERLGFLSQGAWEQADIPALFEKHCQ